MKRIGILWVLCLTLLGACKKDSASGPYNPQITGVNLRDVDAAPAGTLGSPDTKISGQGWSLLVYPIPCITQVNFNIQTTTSGLSAKVKLVSAIYQGAPPTANIENSGLAGVVIREMETGTLTGNMTFSMSVADVPQGFYRLYVEVSNGDMYWDNIWVVR